MLSQIQTLLEIGISEEITFAKEAIYDTIKHLKSLTSEKPSVSRFYSQFARSKIYNSEAYTVIKNQILPAFKSLEIFLEGKYMKHVRKGPGLISMGNLKGEEYYQACLDHSTSIKGVNSTELFLFGQTELKKSQKRLLELSKMLGFSVS